jgi:adenylate cyclase
MSRLFRFTRRVPIRLPVRQLSQKLLAAVVFAIVGTLLAHAVRNTGFVRGLIDQFYDIAYKLREPGDRTRGDVVIVAIDEESLARLGAGMFEEQKLGWPWPRELYGDVVEYLDKAGAKVVAFDLVFSEPDRASQMGTDDTFAEAVNAAKTTKVVFGTRVARDGKPQPIAPPVKEPILGSVQLNDADVLRTYEPFRFGFPSLAYRVAEIFGGSPPSQRDEFNLHYYGPHERKDGRTTYRYIGAFKLLAATRGQGPAVGVEPGMFKDKIVLIGGTSIGLYDAKATPLDKLYPGVEFQATAIENILFRQRVRRTPDIVAFGFTLLSAYFAAMASVVYRRAVLKLVILLIAFATVTLVCLSLFLGETIRWMPLAVPLIAMLIAAITSLAWSYFSEGRQRLFISKAFALSTSPQIAEAISKNPEKLNLGGERREITVMFTDLAGFTDLAETMEVERLAHVVNLYMEAMSDEIVARDGYVDKYIGDAIMSFWNGLVDQPDHAVRACHAALGIKRRERKIAPELEPLVGAKIVTRIGINSGPMAVGTLGSSR